MNISLLEKKGMLQILLFLLDNPESSINAMGRNLKVTITTLRKNTLPTLEEFGLISHVVVEEFPGPHEYSLTEKGKEFALCLKNINK